jgi:thiamine pyrophosphokinase
MHALIVCASPESPSSAWVATLAADADMVIAADGGGAVCLDAGVVPDVLIGDNDSLTVEEVAALSEAGTRLHVHPSDKDDSDLALALAHARAVGSDRVTITGAWGGRADHCLGTMAAMAEAYDLAPRLLEPKVRLWILTRGGRNSLDLAGDGTSLSLFAFGGPVIVSATGVKWPLDRHKLVPNSTLGLSNVVLEADTANVSVYSGTLVVVSDAVGDRSPAVER